MADLHRDYTLVSEMGKPDVNYFLHNVAFCGQILECPPVFSNSTWALNTQHPMPSICQTLMSGTNTLMDDVHPADVHGLVPGDAAHCPVP